MAPPRLKLPKKNRDSVVSGLFLAASYHEIGLKANGTRQKLDDQDDYLEEADKHEEAMRKHRFGDPAKALRFADRALNVYSEGLAKFPRNFDLAYNKARLELEMATDPVLSQQLKVPVRSVLQQALNSHQHARDLEPTHADTLFNMAQVLTALAEIIAEDGEFDVSEALQYIKQALEIQSHCFELQEAAFAKSRLELEQAMRETAQYNTPQTDNGQVATNPTSKPQTASQEEQWVNIEEPVTAETLLDTVIAQLEALSALCSIVSSNLVSSPELRSTSAITLAWVDSYSTKLLTHVLPTLIHENRERLESRLSDVMLPKATFTSKYLELSFRLSAFDVARYRQELDAAFSQPELDAASEGVLLAGAQALISFNSALADLAASGVSNAEGESHDALRWKILVEAQSRLSSVAKIPDVDKYTVATTHLLRGDVSLYLQILAYPPTAYPQARNSTPQLLKHAEIYYRNASKLFASLGVSTNEDNITCEAKGAVVSVLQQVTTDQAASSNSSGRDNDGAMISIPASIDQIERALGPALRAKGENWTRELITHMVSEGMVMPEVFSAIIPF
ncbi:hypothetical protein NUW58_g2745 [Xylaria curta]|uniref:Uncharacterized protein n=1 Tax=Xylaria curta TaxID=42375 RepID=A0ACC1PEM6_9PEZI|nr:hypothetical protein NUW58_g2745 [Xylaria curta]